MCFTWSFYCTNVDVMAGNVNHLNVTFLSQSHLYCKMYSCGACPAAVHMWWHDVCTQSENIIQVVRWLSQLSGLSEWDLRGSPLNCAVEIATGSQSKSFLALQNEEVLQSVALISPWPRKSTSLHNPQPKSFLKTTLPEGSLCLRKLSSARAPS